MSTSSPNFFIVGAPRCGTTAMHGYLRHHPEVFMSAVKEPHYFGRDLLLRGERYAGTRGEVSAYLSLFDGVIDERVIGEASPGYLASVTAAEELRDFAPTARILVMLRPPADLLISLHNHALLVGDEVLPLDEALAAEPDRREGRRIPDQTQAVHTLFYRENVQLATQLNRYLETFGPARVHVELLDDLQSDPAAVYARTCEFLGVDAGFRPDFPVVNQSRRYRSRRLQAVLTDPPKVLRSVGRATGPLAKRAVRAVKQRNRQPVDSSEVAPETRRKLVQEFRPIVNDLSELLDRDLSHWLRESGG